MIRALQLVFAPNTAWGKIAAAQRGVLLVFLIHPLPLMALGCLIEGFGMYKLGILRGSLGSPKPVPVAQDIVLRYEMAQFLAGIVLLFLGAKVIQWVTDSFHVRVRFAAAFAVIAYSIGPLFWLGRSLDGIPWMNTWLCWIIGAIVAVHVLYYGVGLIFQPDQTKGFGVFLMCAIVVLSLGGLAHFVALALLRRQMLV